MREASAPCAPREGRAHSAPSAERETLSVREVRGVGWTEERAQRGTSEHVTREGRAHSAPSAERETQ
jgi:hypothetical protein